MAGSSGGISYLEGCIFVVQLSNCTSRGGSERVIIIAGVLINRIYARRLGSLRHHKVGVGLSGRTIYRAVLSVVELSNAHASCNIPKRSGL